MNYMVEEELKELIVICSGGEVRCDIQENTNLVSALGYNSIRLIQLIVSVEEKLGIEFSENIFNNITALTYKNIRDYICELYVDQQKMFE